MAIKRVWHGWTTPENADAYQDLLRREVFRGIEDKRIPRQEGCNEKGLNGHPRLPGV